MGFIPRCRVGAAWQDTAEGAASDHFGRVLAPPERRQVAQHPRRLRSVVAGGAVVHPLGQGGRVGAPVRAGAAGRRSTLHGVHRRHQHPRPQGSGRQKKGGNSVERDNREAPGRSRVGYGTSLRGIGQLRCLILLDRKRLRPRPFLRAGTRTGTRVAAGAGHAERPAGCARMGCGRPWLCVPCLARPDVDHGRAARDPGQAERCTGCVPSMDLQQSPPRREPVGEVEGSGCEAD